MKKIKVLVIAGIIGTLVGVTVVFMVSAVTKNEGEDAVTDTSTDVPEDEQIDEDIEIVDASIEDEQVIDDMPEYLDPNYEKEIRESFEYNVDMSDVDYYELPNDVGYLVTTEPHKGEDGVVNYVYVIAAYALAEYFDGVVDGVYYYDGQTDVALVGDTSSIFDIHVHGPSKDLLIKVNMFDNVALICEDAE